ncbi:hypothetical protein SDC9_153899 [bioreactor metagenome]|uniref:Uncharacterized protein n=1 Tax=bioreactor metagenome TaxID=1076179 RepID=A0A645F1W6_9ZZZZ
MEFSVGVFERFSDPFDRLDHVKAFDKVYIYLGGIPDQANDRLILPLRNMHLKLHRPEPVAKTLPLLYGSSLFQYDDHLHHPFFKIKKRPPGCDPVRPLTVDLLFQSGVSICLQYVSLCSTNRFYCVYSNKSNKSLQNQTH